MPDPFISLVTIVALLAVLTLSFRPEKGWYYRWQVAQRRSTRILIEDALKHIFIQQTEKRHPSLESIAGALSISINRAAEITRQLESRGLLALHDAELNLTQAGQEYALQVVRAHRLWESYLSENTGYHETDWHRLAEEVEHQLTAQDANALSSRLGYPSHDPHGDPIPTAEGAFSPHAGQPLASLAPGQPARIIHIEDEPSVIYSQIVDAGLHTGMVVTVIEDSPDSIRFQVNGNEHALAPLSAKNVTVLPTENGAVHDETGIPLTDLHVGDTATVASLAPALRGAERRRLMDLGLLPGTRIKAELQSFSGDPCAYLVRGALIALRADQAKHIKIKTH